MKLAHVVINGALTSLLTIIGAHAEGWETRPNPNWSGRVQGSAVWSGSELLVWGGEGPAGPANDGWRYQPQTRAWQAMTTENAPAKRSGHQAAWTGRELLIWGGRGEPNGPATPQGWARGDGGRYDPQLNRWQAMASAGAPSPRLGHASVWTGSEWVIWGGYAGSGWHGLQDAPANLGDGARYQPESDRWLSMSGTGAPSRRHGHTAVWTGSAMLVWGGRDETQAFNNGARYEPATDRWLPMASANAPAGRFQHQAIWTGSEMIVWGGRDKDGEPVFEGGRYDPVSNTWRPLGQSSELGNLSLAPAAWTGGEWILWGGYDPVNSDWVANGARYDARWNSWTTLPTAGAPSRRWPMVAWTGQELLVLGGTDRAGLRTEMSAYLLPVVTNVVFQNHPPVLAAIPDRTVAPAERLNFSAIATDPDLPAQVLTFSLTPDAPAGASVDPVTGRFDWTPSAVQAPSTNRITVRVSDGSLTDTKMFTVLVRSLAPITGSLQVTLEPAEARIAGAQWRRVGTGVWRNSGTTETDVVVGSCEVEFKVLTGWATPANRAVTIQAGQTALITGTYGASPQITQQPQSRTVAAGTGVTFTVTATGVAPLSYQWFKNGSAIAGATTSAFSLQPSALIDAGNYTVLVSNAAGSVTSQPAQLVVILSATLAGVVNDAVTGQPLAGVTVSAGGRTTTTDTKGSYTLTGLAKGTLNADFSADVMSGAAPLTVHFANLSTRPALVLTGDKTGYVTYRNTEVTVTAGQTNTLSFSLSPVLNQGLRAVLNWADKPKDLDLHLQVLGTNVHVYYNRTNAPGYARLDHDDFDGFGPETITIEPVRPLGYHFYVNKLVFVAGELRSSQAELHLYEGARELQAIRVPASGTGDYWHVCVVDGASGGITVVNQITGSETLPIDWQGSVTNRASAYTWDFGDGTSSVAEQPVKVYERPGLYSVSLRVAGEPGQSDVKVKSGFVVVTGAGSGARLGAAWVNGRVVLSVGGEVGKTYRIESAPSVGAGAVWQTVATLTLSSPVQSWTDDQSSVQRTRYYRAVSP